jgi:hypothetical protein
VIAKIVENPEVPWGKDKLDTVFDGLHFGGIGGSGCVLGCRIWRLHVLGPTEDVIPASGERIFT